MRTAGLIAAIQHPESWAAAELPAWDGLLRLARRAQLLGVLAERLRAAGLESGLPEPVRAALKSERVLSDANRRAVAWEVRCLRRALAALGLPVILLKGAAYASAELPPAAGRLFGDIDVLVPQERLADVERALTWAGWDSGSHDAYDERYYRTWMHELPPMRHRKRESVLDVHHTILPPTARYHPDPGKLRADARELPGRPGVRVLAPTDMVLHSACHLFHEGEWEHGLRDLHDLDALLRCFGAEPGFWERLVARAAEMELRRPLHYALRYVVRLWTTPVPEPVLAALAPAGPGALMQRLMDGLFLRAIVPRHSLLTRAGDGLAHFCLYLRAHWLRMPVHLLLPHLLRKALKPKPKPEPA